MDVCSLKQTLLDLLPEHITFLEDKIFPYFILDDCTLLRVQNLLDRNIDDALFKKKDRLSPLDLFPSYVCDQPDGTERGVCLGIDLGGTKFRTLLTTINDGKTQVDIESYVLTPEILGGTGTQLFDCLADAVSKLVTKHGLTQTDHVLPLGITFSFPVKQTALDEAVLRQWTKNFTCSETIGKDVVKLLNESLQRKGLRVRCVAVINDTVGTLVAGAVKDTRCRIGLICGTGTNACYFESPHHMATSDTTLLSKEQVAIDTKWNNFGDDGSTDFLRSEFDIEVNDDATHSKQAICEKMMCSLFAGELIRLILKRMSEEKIGFHGEQWRPVLDIKGSILCETRTIIVSDDIESLQKTRDVLFTLGVTDPYELECKVIHHVCRLVITRAADITAACLSCLVKRTGRTEVGVAIDGSFYMGSQLFAARLEQTLMRLVDNGVKPFLIPVTDGSGFGALVVASVQARKTSMAPVETMPETNHDADE